MSSRCRALHRVVCLLVLSTAVAACTSGGDPTATGPSRRPDTATASQPGVPSAPSPGAPDTSAPSSAPDASGPPSAPVERTYVSIGDSYATGFRPGVGGTTDGFPYRVEALSQGSTHPLRLVNFGCSGATSSQMMNERGCSAAALGPGATPYPDQPQAVAAVGYLREHAASVDLVTVVIGGNDVQRCLSGAAVTACVEEALPALQGNVSSLVRSIREVIGPDVPIVGLTYPDVYLAAAAGDGAGGAALAALSLQIFRAQLNPALSGAYADNSAQFLDVTALTGAYGDMTRTTTLEPYGVLPEPVAQVCRLTYFCSDRDVHPTAAGHAFLADAVLTAAFGR